MLQSNQALVTWIQRQYQLCYTDKIINKAVNNANSNEGANVKLKH